KCVANECRKVWQESSKQCAVLQTAGQASHCEFLRMCNHRSQHFANLLVTARQLFSDFRRPITTIPGIIDPTLRFSSLSIRICQLADKGVGILALSVALSNICTDTPR